MDLITSRAVKAELARAIAAGAPPAWVMAIANEFRSDQASEQYPWLSAAPVLREWIGGRNAKGLTENQLTIANKHFEASLPVQVKDLRRDKLGVLRVRIAELVRRAYAHPASLISTLMLNGESALCYDGQYFYDTDHAEGNSGIQSNSISVDISALPSVAHGATTLPSVPELQLAIGQAIAAMVSFKDSEGEPMNEDASSFVVMVPPTWMQVGMQAVATPVQLAESQTVLTALKQDFSITCVPNVRLASWTTKFTVNRVDGAVKPFIFQRETAINVSAKAEGSDYEHDNAAHEYGVDYWGNAAYGLWQNSCLVTLV